MNRAFLVTVFAVFFTAAAHAQIEWSAWETAAIRHDRTEPVRFEAEVSAAAGVTALRLDYGNGGALMLTPIGNGRFTASIPAARALDGYAADDVNRNFVGYLRLLGPNGAVTASMNLFINVLDARIAAVPVKERSSVARETARIVNLHRPVRAAEFAEEVRQAVRQFYEYHSDQFDFVQVVFSMPSYRGNRYHINARNDVAGIGMARFDQTAAYGSTGRLLGLNVYPLDGFFDCGESAFSHETGHQWINTLDNPRVAANAPHWPYSTMATGVMGYSTPGGAGGDFPYVIEPAEPDSVSMRAGTTDRKTFTDFDLYLMGLIPPSEVRDGFLLDAAPCVNCTVPATRFTIDELIAVNGPRIPAAGAAQRSFRVATIVVTRDRLLTNEELAFFEHFAARGEAREPLPFTAGFGRGTTNPFHLATRGLATVDLRLEIPAAGPRRRAVRK